jgi:hypothetical protein
MPPTQIILGGKMRSKAQSYYSGTLHGPNVQRQRGFRFLGPWTYQKLVRIKDVMVNALVVNSEAVRQYLIHAEKVPPNLTLLVQHDLFQ